MQQLINERILVLDGAMGTMIQQYNLSEADFRGERFKDLPGLLKGNNDMLCLTRPDVIEEIHRKYLEAGADIIETNTFNATAVSMADYHMQAYCREINLAAARLARKIADEYTARTPEKPRFVAGSVGPTNKTCSMSPDVNNPAFRALTFDELSEAYREQMEALLEGGVDAILIETIFDTLNAKAAVLAAETAMQNLGRKVPLMLSVTVSDVAGRTLSGQTLDAFLASVQHADIFSIGLNCSFGARQLKPFLEQLARRAPYYISAYPNAGLPNSLGQYDQTPEEMAAEVKEYIDEGLVNIIGGCCGTTEAYIAKYQELIKDAKPHVPAPKPDYLWLSGLELLEVTPEINFVNVGERCNVAGSRKFLRLINEKKYDEALSIARKQVEDGALVIDVNMDDGLLDAAEEMTTFLNLVASEPDIARVPVMIDSSKWEVILAGLKCVQGKCIVNSISLKEGEGAFVEHARTVKQYGAAVIVMAFDEKGQADTFERKIEVCERAYRILTEKVGFRPQDIIFDPNVLAVATGIEEHNNYAVDFIKATQFILFLPLILLLSICLLLFVGLHKDPKQIASALIDKPVPEFYQANLLEPSQIVSPRDFPKKPFLLNVWGSWCGYCQQEHPLLMEISKEVPIVGIDYRDKPQNGIAMLERMGNPFILTIDDSRGEFAMQLGVDGAPETYVVDEHGMIRYRHSGYMDRETWLTEIKPKLDELTKK